MTDKSVVVVGAAEDGIGEAVARLMAQDGWSVIGTYESEKSTKADSLRGELENIELVEVDHSSRESLVKFSRGLDGRSIDAVIVVQMMFEMEKPDAFSHDLWDKMISVNLTMPNIVVHELKQNMSAGSAIVIVTSTEAFMGSFGASAYASTKAAMHNLVKTHANNLGPKEVRVNAVVPGWIGGVMDTDEVFNMSRNITPLRRLGAPEEVAKACRFMVSEDASFITGTTLVVDGGYSGVDTISKFEFDAENK